MKSNLRKFILILFSGMILISCSDENGAGPEIDPPVELPDITVTVDAFPKFTCATEEITFYINQLSDETVREHISLKFDIDGDGVFEESVFDSTGWKLSIGEMGLYNVNVIIQYDNVSFDTTQIKLDITSEPVMCIPGSLGNIHEYVWSWDSKKIVLVYQSHQPFIFDMDDWLNNRVVLTGDYCHHNAVMSPDNRFVAYDDAWIEYYDRVEKKEYKLIEYVSNENDYQPHGIAWSPLGDQIVFTNMTKELFIVSFPEGEITKFEEQADICGWSYDAGKLLLSTGNSQYSETIKIYDLETQRITKTFDVEIIDNPGSHAERIYWIKNTNWIFSSLSRTFINIETSEMKQIFLPFNGNNGWMDLEYTNQAQVSPNGRYVAFQRFNKDLNRIEMDLVMVPENFYK